MQTEKKRLAQRIGIVHSRGENFPQRRQDALTVTPKHWAALHLRWFSQDIVQLDQAFSELGTEATDSLEGRVVIQRHVGSTRVKFEGSVDDVSAGPFLARWGDIPEKRYIPSEGSRNAISETEGQRCGTHVLESRVCGSEA